MCSWHLVIRISLNLFSIQHFVFDFVYCCSSCYHLAITMLLSCFILFNVYVLCNDIWVVNRFLSLLHLVICCLVSATLSCYSTWYSTTQLSGNRLCTRVSLFRLLPVTRPHPKLCNELCWSSVLLFLLDFVFSACSLRTARTHQNLLLLGLT